MIQLLVNRCADFSGAMAAKMEVGAHGEVIGSYPQRGKSRSGCAGGVLPSGVRASADDGRGGVETSDRDSDFSSYFAHGPRCYCFPSCRSITSGDLSCSRGFNTHGYFHWVHLHCGEEGAQAFSSAGYCLDGNYRVSCCCN